MALNYENNIVFTGSDDGTVGFMTIIDLDKRPKIVSIPPVTIASEVLVQGKLRSKLLREIDIKSIELEERKNENAMKLELRKKNFNAQMNDLKHQTQMEDERGHEQTADMKQLNEDAMRAHESQKGEMHDHHVKRLQQMNREHERKIKNDNDKFQALLEQKE